MVIARRRRGRPIEINGRHVRFALELHRGATPPEAAAAAGFSTGDEAYRLLAKPSVQAAIRFIDQATDDIRGRLVGAG